MYFDIYHAKKWLESSDDGDNDGIGIGAIVDFSLVFSPRYDHAWYKFYEGDKGPKWTPIHTS